MSGFDHGQTPKTRQMPPNKTALVAALDIGSSKIACLIARLTPSAPGEALRGRTHAIEVIGIGHQRSRGIKSGVVTNLEAAEQAIRMAVDAAERQAGVTVESLIVAITCGRLASEAYAASVSLPGQAIADADIGRVLAEGRRHSISEGRVAVHSLPIGYSLDGEGGIADPRGMVGRRLGVDMHVVTGDAPALIRGRGLEDRIAIESGSFFESVPAGGDAYILSHIIHDWSEEQCQTILGNCRRAMKPASKLLIVESVLPPDDTPHFGKVLDMVMLAMPGGEERTESEYAALLASAGFRLTRVVPTASAVGVVEAVLA